jgi:hypothetical protein
MNKLPKSKSKYGYTKEEVEKILVKLNIDKSKFWLAFGINTCALINGKIRYYKCDIERTLFELGNKLGKYYEWD